LIELETRYDYAKPQDYDGVDETCRIDRVLHSLFGASKLAADVVAQEYGRYFGMPIGIFRAGCVTGPNHSGVELHGFLSYLTKAIVHGRPYTIFGYKGKQVRDNIHSYDVANIFYEFYQNPRSGEVYNLGGGRANSVSVLEAIQMIQDMTGRKIISSYSEEARRGDHICYISNLEKLKAHYPKWSCTRSLDDILHEIVQFELNKSSC
jgi:CDP-paratose 2-epimerase